MANYLPLPDGTFYPVAAGEDPKAAWQRAMQKYPEAFADKAPEEGPKSGFMPALKAGFAGLKGDVAALAGRTGIMGLPEAEKYIAEQEAYQKKTFAPTKESFLEAPLANIKELAGGSIPYMVAPVAAGAATFALPATLAAAPVLGGLTTAGTALGLGAAGLTSAGQFTGSNLTRQMAPGEGMAKKGLGETDLTDAALAAIPQAALDTLSMRMIPGLGKMFERAGVNLSAKAANDLAKEGIKKTAADYLLATGKTMGVEGLTEAGQQVFERMQAGLEIDNPTARAEYFESFLGGAVLGGILAPAGRYVERGQEQARFDKGAREKQAADRTAASQAAEQAAAVEEAQKQTPDYAQKAQQAYMAAEQRKTELEAQMHRAGKGVKLTEDQKQDNKETQQALREHADVLKEANAEFRKYRQFLPPEPAPALAKIENTTQLQQPEMFGAPAAPATPELDMFGNPVERASTADEVLANEQQRSLYGPDSRQAQLQQTFDMYDQTVGNRGKAGASETLLTDNPDVQQARALKGYLDHLREQNAALPPTAFKEKQALAEKYATVKKALDQIQSSMPAMPDVLKIQSQIATLTKKLADADANGDLDAVGKHAAKLESLHAQLAAAVPAPSPQMEMAMQPFKGMSETREQFRDRRSQELGDQRAETLARLDAEYNAAQEAYIRTMRVQAETKALQRIGERPPVVSQEQFGLFGPDEKEVGPSTPSSAPLGQMKQQLLGEDVTATADEAAPARPQRGGPAPFNLYSRREGTGEPVTADSLQQRVYDLQKRTDLSEEAQVFLRRAATNIGSKDTAIGANDSLYTMLDEQLGKIERNEEGVTSEGTGKPTNYQGFPVQTPATSTTAPTVAVGKDLAARTSTDAKALAAARRAKYDELVAQVDDQGKQLISNTEAARRASLVKQENVTGPFAGREAEAAAPAGEVGIQKRGDAAEATTLRGPSTQAKPLSMPPRLEEHLRVKEGLRQESEGQLPLFKDKELAPTAVTRATPATFQRFLDSKPVQEMREREAAAKKQAEQLPEAQKTHGSIKELEAKVNELKNLNEQTTTAKSILNGNKEVEAAITAYGKLQDDPLFTALLRLNASSRSQEYLKLQENITVFTKAADDLRKQIATTQTALAKPVKATATVNEGLRDKRVKLDILQRQQSVLTSTLTKLEALKANADAAEAAVKHIDTMLAVMAAKKTLAAMEGRAFSREELINAQVALTQALNAKRAAEAASKAQDMLRDTRDRSSATKQKADAISAARSRAWNQMASLPSTKYRARTAAEERAFVTAAPGEVSAAMKYEQHLAGMAIIPLKMELGRLEQQARVLEKQIQTAKAKSESFLKPADNPAASIPSPSGPFSPLENRNYPAATGEKLVMYGPKGSIFTKPAFVGIEGFLKKQADLMVKIDALEKELGVKEASATPIATRKGEAQERAVAPITDEEADLIGMTEEKIAAQADAKARVAELEANLKSAQEDKNGKLVTAFAKDLAQARKDLAEAEFSKKRRLQLVKRQTSAPYKLRTGSAEKSKATPGYTRQRLEEGKVEDRVTPTEALRLIETSNKLSEESKLARKKLTKKEIATMSLAQQDALQKATFDRLMYVRQQVSNAQQVVNNLKQAQADYKAGGRKTFNLDVLTAANKKLAEFTKELSIASQQAGISEDVGKMSKDELKEVGKARAARSKKGKSAKDIEAQATEAAVSDVYVGQDLGEEGMQRGTSGANDTPLSEQNIARLRSGNVGGVLAQIAGSSGNQVARRVAGKVQSILGENGVAVRLVDKTTVDSPDAPGMISKDGKRISINERTGLSEESVLHESVHAATMFELDKPDEKLTPDQRVAKKGLTKMMEQVKADDAFDNNVIKEGDIHEFVAEGNASKVVQEYMRGKTFDNRSMWQKFKDFLLRLVGVKTPPSEDMLNKFLDMSEQFMRAKEAGAVDLPAAKLRAAEYKSDDALSKLAERTVAQPKSLRERAGSNIALQFEMQAADMRAGVIKALNNAVEDPNTMGSTRDFRQAIFSITAADQHGAITQMALSNGPPTMFKDSKGYYEVRSTMKNDAGAVFDAVQDVPDSYGNTEAKMGLAGAYMIAQRATNKGLKKLDLGALGVTEQELSDVMASVNADPKLKDALENVRAKYNAFNRGMIEWLSSPQVAAITQADAKAYLKDEDYVPYYRVRADGVAELVFGGEKTITIGDIRHQPYLAELKGGNDKIMPLDKSIMRNTMLLVTKGMNNMAMKNVGYAMQAAGQGLGPVDKTGKPTNLMPVHMGKGGANADNSIIRWTQEPDPSKPNDNGDRWLRIQTTDTMFGGVPAELIIKSLEGAHLTLPAFLKWGGIAGDLLRSGVTRTPIYLARQLFRDPFAATATSGLDYGPVTAIFKANREFLKIAAGKSEAGAKMIEKGLIQSGMFEGDPANMSKMALQLASGKSQGVFDKLFAKADKLALQADAATRALIYENAIKNGLSEVEASQSVRESMNFTKRGLSPTVQYASRMIPFFNAQIQGLSVLFKAATGNMPANDVLKIKRKFFNNAMLLTGFGIAYAMAMDDDDYYKNAKPRDRYTNFFVPLPGVDEPLKLPIPYEFGFFFSAGVALADAIKGEVDTPQQLRALKDMFVGAIPGASSNFMPQIIKPIAEVYANKSFFSGNTLVSARLEKLDPVAQYNANTTELAKFMAKMVPGLSPIQIEHIVSGYLGQIPLMVVATTNDLFRDGKEEPTRKLSEMPLIGSSFQRKYGGEDADVVYKLATDAMEAKRTFDNYRKTGKIEDAKDYLREHRAEIAVAPMALQYQKLMGAIRTQEDLIRNSNASSDAKEKRIDALNAQRQLQSERYLKAIRRAEESVGRTTPQ